MTEPATEERYRVVVNDEDQYSIWPQERELPAGWSDAGYTGPKTACLDHIERIWTDMRPRSLRSQMEGQMGSQMEGQ